MKPKEGESFADFRQRVQARANALEKQYQPKLTDGIKINISLMNSAKEDEKDGDVDVKVKIAPNTEERLATVYFNKLKENSDEIVTLARSAVERVVDELGNFTLNKLSEKIKEKVLQYVGKEPECVITGERRMRVYHHLNSADGG